MNRKMKIVVIGGTGLIGTKLVNNLHHRGEEVVTASRSSGVNTLTGEGLAEAIAGAHSLRRREFAIVRGQGRTGVF